MEFESVLSKKNPKRHALEISPDAMRCLYALHSYLLRRHKKKKKKKHGLDRKRRGV